ncbi:MAG: hypothetical protein AMXMBFR37_07380 [Steroidobacteraceae bacterium]|jgi:DNA repair protein RadC
MKANDVLWLNEGRELRRALDEEILASARLVMQKRVRRGVRLESPQLTQSYLIQHLGVAEHEVFMLLLLDSRHRLIRALELFRGTIDGASVHPREVVKEALRHNAAACVFAHNHPSGVAEASQADELITRRLREALALVDIRVLDHIIVGGGEALSFAERGLL